MINPVLRLVRLESTNAGTLGTLVVGGRTFCTTLEPPDQANARDVSCIPEGQYTCERKGTKLCSITSLGCDATFEVMDVPARSHILIHPGNSAGDTQGCILLGQYPGYLKRGTLRAALNSRTTWRKFMRALEGYDAFVLTITNSY